VDKLFNFRVLVLRNEDSECRVIELTNKYQLNRVTNEYCKSKNVVQIVLPNPQEDPMCPFIIMIMENYATSSVVNYKLETLFRNLGIKGLHARCSVALVMGMMTPLYMDSMVDIPEFFRLCNMTFYGTLGDIELTSMKSVVVEISRSAGFEYPLLVDDLGFVLLGPCLKCSKGKVSCSKMLPCTRCEKIPHEEVICQFSQHELASRAKVMMRSVSGGTFTHNDIARYQLHLQCNQYGLKNILQRNEAKDIFDRIHAEVDTEKARIDYDMENLATPIKDLIEGEPYFKVEWMDNGRYMIKTSMAYKKNFLPLELLVVTAKKLNVAPKMIDMCNLNEFDMAFQMWVESIVNERVVVRYTGTAWWADDKVVAKTTVKMVTVMTNPMTMITATIISKI
jgi:hypothetical protein